MNDAEKGLAASLARLLNASIGIERVQTSGSEQAEFAAAREQAAKALLLHRVRRGEPWLALPHLTSFWDRWRRLKHVVASARHSPW